MAERPEHMHCPLGCYHPQPFERDGKWYCGCCFFNCSDGMLTPMVTGEDAKWVCNCGEI
jgi:hypothetical protein